MATSQRPPLPRSPPCLPLSGDVYSWLLAWRKLVTTHPLSSGTPVRFPLEKPHPLIVPGLMSSPLLSLFQRVVCFIRGGRLGEVLTTNDDVAKPLESGNCHYPSPLSVSLPLSPPPLCLPPPSPPPLCLPHRSRRGDQLHIMAARTVLLSGCWNGEPLPTNI